MSKYQVMPPHSTEEKERLRADILARGLMDAVHRDDEGSTLDGHQRLEICRELGLEPQFITVDGFGEGEAADLRKKAYAYRRNRNRRQLSSDQEREVERGQRQLARELNQLGLKQTEIASELGVTQPTVSRWLDVSNMPSNNANGRADHRVKIPPKEHPRIYERYKAGDSQTAVAADYKVAPSRISQIVKKREKREKFQASESALPPSIEIHQCDFRRMPLKPESVNVVMTDPPYSTKDHFSLQDWDDLGARAALVLKPGGVFLALTGTFELPKTLNRLGRHLEWATELGLYLPAGENKLQRYELFETHRTILYFYKPPLILSGEWIETMQKSLREKDLHDWQQALPAAEKLIRKFCPGGGTVFDPCTGSGTTAVACLRTGRSFIGCDIDPKAVATAKARVAEEAAKLS